MLKDSTTLHAQPSFAKNAQALYDVPSFTEEHTRMHFPQAEAGWLNMAAAGKIGDDVKSDDEQGNLTSIIDEWREKAYDEKALAREEAAIAARDDNYLEYNITKGVATHKVYNGGVVPAAASKAGGAAPKLAGNKGAASPKLAAGKNLSPRLAVAHGKGIATLARKTPAAAHYPALPARVRAEEQIMQRTIEKEMVAQERLSVFHSEMKQSMHFAQMKLAHQEMGFPVRHGPTAEKDTARTQSLGDWGVGPEGDHLNAIKKAEVVNEPLDASLISENDAPADDTIDEVNVAIASQQADGYTNGEGAAVEDITLPEDE